MLWMLLLDPHKLLHDRSERHRVVSIEGTGIIKQMKAPSSVLTITQLLDQLGRKLVAQGQLLAVAESCTGGEFLAAASSKAGASEWLWGGWVVYSNRAKQKLGVPSGLIRQHGAVSREAVASLCACARSKSQASMAVSISGIAGPEGGTKEKPTGTVWIGTSYLETGQEQQWRFYGDRKAIRVQASIAAARMLLRLVEKDHE